MKISICIPQYNRIQFLLRSLDIIKLQNYPSLEIVISDDCSTDDTEIQIRQLSKSYKYPIVYNRNIHNLGYDRNYRRCIELATGIYAIVIGNDDTINPELDIENLVKFLQEQGLPEIGFCNYLEESSGNTFVLRAQKTKVLGSGYEVAMSNYSCFSFVGGLIYKKSAFDRFNTANHDGSIYAQIYLGSLMVASGCNLFSIYEPYIIKDIVIEKFERNSYKDVIAKKWKDYKIENGGLPSVINVLIHAFKDAGVINQRLIYKIFRRIYLITYPFWILDYKSNGAFPAAVGLVQGLKPTGNANFHLLSFYNKIRIWIIYLAGSFFAILMPVFFFKRIHKALYNRIKLQK